MTRIVIGPSAPVTPTSLPWTTTAISRQLGPLDSGVMVTASSQITLPPKSSDIPVGNRIGVKSGGPNIVASVVAPAGSIIDPTLLNAAIVAVPQGGCTDFAAAPDGVNYIIVGNTQPIGGAPTATTAPALS